MWSQLYLVKLTTQIKIGTRPEVLLGGPKISSSVLSIHVLIFLVVNFDGLSLPHDLSRVVSLNVVIDVWHALANKVLLRHHLSLRHVTHELMLLVLRFVGLEIRYRM